jgi:hypothetical protein
VRKIGYIGGGFTKGLKNEISSKIQWVAFYKRKKMI